MHRTTIKDDYGRGRFERWPLIAPMVLEFLKG